MLIAGEDGAISYTTRSMSVRDAGERKRDLLWRLGDMVYEARGGAAAMFSSWQSLAQFCGAVRAQDGVLALNAGTQLKITPRLPVLTV
jgi:hypothetical protein